MNQTTKGVAYARALARELRSAEPDLAQIARRLGLEIREVDADGFDGALVRVRGVPCGVIAIRKSIREPGRKQFTLAHEIGHFLLPERDATERVCTNWDIGNWGDASQQAEREADAFAAEILMPTTVTRPMVDSAKPSLQAIEKIAKRFGTSFSAAAWRYCDLTKHACAIVWSTQDKIEWSMRSEAFTYTLRRGAPVTDGTLAFRIFHGAAVPKQPQLVPANLWISGLAEDDRIYEQSKVLPSYNSVISLLWLKAE